MFRGKAETRFLSHSNHHKGKRLPETEANKNLKHAGQRQLQPGGHRLKVIQRSF